MIVYRELSSLERDLGISARTLYAVSNCLNRHYRTVQLPKKGGGFRTLSVPDECLKAIQRRIADVLLPLMEVSSYAKAYRDGGSTLKNAAVHVGKPLVLKLDILHFFDSIFYSSVKNQVFPAEMYAEPLRILLAMLCYHGDGLPQGAPTSPAISNILLREFDEQVGAWCRAQGIAYTRYCDDLTFSGDFDPGTVAGFACGELRKLGFLLNQQKTRVQRRSAQQSVTGIVVNEAPAVPIAYRRKLRQEVYYCRKFGVDSHLEKTGAGISAAQYLHRLLGQVSYVLHVSPDDKEMQRAAAWLRQQLKN